ncbi:nikkomycin biosynthesis domain protein [Pseudomonas syringae pv. actinidiae ICMP 19071]|uniref:ATP-grasp domain-containing protein n=1 Tax=Pseudomonas syringae TaxID=317 RepID=UPI0003578BDC|nr:ATP-grasp domain-containing protein [Pseudomonas syringae]EPM60820.1 nikkomycin biosynthesis domain protein [Pseudomonas syringae pv. actinidiae ICMP 19071]EPM78498.1 nikkomycin biosynthesis domain protein [Pseudomonas syringae pv. actinidiae ICMP 19072]OSN69739.1 L-arginine-specific L-amino acid ligase [Pseudomonas syringae pv. actinidiae]OSN79940.1 L-arginine-specific L-amino acid ligase [Pseudomonas syringae pv. actinidiae]PBK48905.1 serine kinase [Pseudomonas syringae pv. actinidiae]
MRPTKKILVVSSELDAAKTVRDVKTMYPSATWDFIFLLEDFLGVANDELKCPEHFIVRDFADTAGVMAVLEVIAQQHVISQVVPSDEFSVYIAALANDRWDLPGITREKAKSFRDKKAMKEIAQHAGIRTAREITLSDIKGGYVEFPVVVKPRSLAGSMGVKIITEAKQLTEMDVDWGAAYRDMDERQYMIEQYNPNTIYHIDCIVLKGHLSFISVGQYLGKPIDFLQEKPVGVLSVPDQAVEDTWRPFAESVIKAFEAPEGVYHIEAFADAGFGLELLEIAYRPGGAAIVEMIEMVHGLNLKCIHLAAQLGLVDYVDSQRQEEAFGYMTFPKKHLSTEALYVTKIFLPPLESMPTLRTHVVPTLGDIASGEFYCYKDSLGSFVFCGDRDLVSRDVHYLSEHYSVQVAAKNSPPFEE